MARPTVAEMQADPEFQALPESDKQVLLRDAMTAGAARYQGAPDQPLQTGAGDVPDSWVANTWRYGGPAAGALLGPAGFVPSLATAAGVGAASTGLADVAEGKDLDPGRMALGGALNTVPAVAARPLGALAGVAKAKLSPGRLIGDIDLTQLGKMAGQAEQAKGLVGPRAAAAGATIKELVEAAPGGRLPINAPNLEPSVELIRKGIPYKQPGGKQMYGALRGAVREQAPEYNTLLEQYRAANALGGLPTFKELITAGLLGGGGGLQYGWKGLLAALLPRVGMASYYAPAAPTTQAALTPLTSALGGPR